MSNIKVLAIDQATKTCGFCIMDSKTKSPLNIGCVELTGKDYSERIYKFQKWLRGILKKEKIDHVFLEDIQFQSNRRTYKVLAEMLGVLKNVCLEEEVPFQTVPPVTWKSHCNIKGKKRTEQKANTIKYAATILGKEFSEDASDAICIAIYGCDQLEQ